jgi:hypothetical protein
MLASEDKADQENAQVLIAGSFLRDKKEESYFAEREAFRILMNYMIKNKRDINPAFITLTTSYQNQEKILCGGKSSMQQALETPNRQLLQFERISMGMIYCALLTITSSCFMTKSEEEVKMALTDLILWYGRTAAVPIPGPEKQDIRDMIENVLDSLVPLSNEAKLELYIISERHPEIQPAADRLLQNKMTRDR